MNHRHRHRRLQAAAAMESRRRKSWPPVGKRQGGGSAIGHRGRLLLLDGITAPRRVEFWFLAFTAQYKGAHVPCPQNRTTATKKRREKEMELPPPASLVVRSPRQTLSLLRNRRPQREREPPTSLAAGPKPSEVYGFVGSITTVIATAVYLVWAYTPESCLRSLGITYYPAKYWALAVPSLVMVAVALSMLVYMGFNFLATPPPTSFNTIFDEYTRERSTTMLASPPATTQAETPIEPISDISIHQINNLMFAD